MNVILISFLILSIVCLIIICFSIKALLSLEKRMSELETLLQSNVVSSYNEENKSSDMSSDLINNLNKIKDDDKKYHTLLELSRRTQNAPNSGGELIPVNLTNEELNILKTFYEKS